MLSKSHRTSIEGCSSVSFTLRRSLALDFETERRDELFFLSVLALSNFMYVNSWSGLNLTPKVHI